MPTQRHTYSYPTQIEYGPGAVSDLVAIVQRAGFKKGLLVTDEGVVNVGSPEKISDNFKAAGIEISTFSDVKSNPQQ
jgi:alcohol dehydrogenase class IV